MFDYSLVEDFFIMGKLDLIVSNELETVGERQKKASDYIGEMTGSDWRRLQEIRYEISIGGDDVFAEVPVGIYSMVVSGAALLISVIGMVSKDKLAQIVSIVVAVIALIGIIFLCIFYIRLIMERKKTLIKKAAIDDCISKYELKYK